MKTSNSLIGLAPSIGCLLLCSVFLYLNPYSTTSARLSTLLILIIALMIPALVGIAASLKKSRTMMYIAFFWSLPYGIYLGVASFPSLWNMFLIILAYYWAADRQINRKYVGIV